MDEWTVAHLDALNADELARLPAAQIDALKRLLGANRTSRRR
jgi:hypothetical protein